MSESVSIIAAIGKNRELGFENRLLWQIPDDLKRFRKLTIGHPVIMGRSTFESIGRPLDKRINIVLSRNHAYRATGCYVVHSFSEALQKTKLKSSKTPFVIGGAQIYQEALPRADTLYLTHINASAQADAFFPAFEDRFSLIQEEQGLWNDLSYRFCIYTRC